MDKKLISRVMAELGRRTSKAKAAAARKNGKLGGRPRKIVTRMLDAAQTKELFGDLLEVNP